MKKITENYLFLTRQRDFTNRLLSYFYRRLGIFLCLDLDNIPDVLLTSNENKIAEYYNDPNDTNYGRAFFSDEFHIVVFNANRYDSKSEKFHYTDEYENLCQSDPLLGKYKYAIPLSDIYHELIHSVQDECNVYDFDDMIEATDEMLSYFITGQYNIDYVKATMSLWYVSRYVLKLDRDKLYVFIRDSIVDPDYHTKYYLTNKGFVKMLAKNYNGDFKKFVERFKIDFYKPDLFNEFKSDIQYIHNLIFYKY